MSSISIIGTGHMARILGTLAVEGGNAVEVIGRDPAKAAELTPRSAAAAAVADGHPAREPPCETLSPGRQPARVARSRCGEGASRPRARARATASPRRCVPSFA